MADDEPNITDEEHEEFLQETLPYDWIAEAIRYASEEVAIDLRDLLRPALEQRLAADRLAEIRMERLVSALEDQVGVPSD